MSARQAYWLAIPQAINQTVTGFPVDGYTVHISSPGWYMIGSVSKPVDLDDLHAEPEGAFIAALGWNPATQSYYPATELARGEGCWLAIAQACDLTVGNGAVTHLAKTTTKQSWADFIANFGSKPPQPPSAKFAESAGAGLPKEFNLARNYPNPFNPETRIEYALPKAVFVQLEIYNLLGQKVRTLVEKEQPAGFQKAVWDSRDESGRAMPGGVYLLRIKAGEYTAVRKITLLR
jgi:hypothetical protein